jgi:hypothetical protein
MSLIASDSGGGSSFTPVPPGLHMARCYRIVDLGTQKTTFNGELKHQHKIMLQFEVHGEDDKGAPLVTPKGEPMSISKNYTLSLSDKATLRADLQAWRGEAFNAEELRGFDIRKVLGKWAMIAVGTAVGKDGKTYTNILNLNPVPKVLKDTLPVPHNPAAIFSITNPDMDLFNSFSNSLREKISASPEWQSRGGDVPNQSAKAQKQPASSGFDDMDDDIPF